ncbi:hypothetical protein AMTRI_Chr11g152470 [Amborella trichopoda]
MLRHGGTKSSRHVKVKGIDYTLFFSQFDNLQQETKSMSEYTEEFYKLMARNDIQETEEQLVSRYVGGLRLAIRDEVEMHWLWIKNAYQLALKVEAKLSRGCAWKYVEVCSFYPPSKDEPSKEGKTSNDLPKNSTTSRGELAQEGR